MLKSKSKHNIPKRKLKFICILFIIIGIILLCAYPNNIYIKFTIFSTSFSNQIQQREITVASYYNAPMPCIQPHCYIQCYSTYTSNEENRTKYQREHLMIDLGEDRIVQQLIQSIPPFKQCSVRYYPILFGFIEQYFPKSQSRQILIHNQIRSVEQMCLPRKAKAFNDLIPGKLDTYKFGFENELDYRRLYSSAYFAITMKKGGWDCNRHYEILTSGTMPFFDNLNQAGKHTLSLLPKPLLYEAQQLKGVNRINMTIDLLQFNIDEYYLLLHRVLYYAKHRLTTVKVAEYILRVINYSMSSSSTNHSVLYISHYQPDYLKDFMLHGFTNIFRENFHVFQPPRYLYEYPLDKMWTRNETTNYFQHKLYGLGYGYKLCLSDYLHLYKRDKIELANETTIENNIKMKKYSLIIYGSILRENRFYSLVKQYYESSRVVLLDGEDEGKDIRRRNFTDWGTYFLREIPDDCNLIV